MEALVAIRLTVGQVSEEATKDLWSFKQNFYSVQKCFGYVLILPVRQSHVAVKGWIANLFFCKNEECFPCWIYSCLLESYLVLDKADSAKVLNMIEK